MVKKIFFQNNKGMLTLELVIAFAILILNVTAVLMLTSSGQSIYVDGETNAEAIYKSQTKLEDIVNLSKTDFNSVINQSTTDGIFTNKIAVIDLSPCKKNVSSKTEWQLSPVRPLDITLAQNIIDTNGVINSGGDCATESPYFEDWRDPQVYSQINMDGSANGLDVFQKIVYMAMTPSGKDKPNFFVVDTSKDIFNPSIYSISTAPAGESSVLFHVDAAKQISTGKVYAYVANSYFVDGGNKCKKKFSNQLQVVDVTDITNTQLIASRTLKNVDQCGSFPAGYSVAYYNNKVYIGTKETSGDELTIFDVTSPTNPTEIASINVARNINAIALYGDYAYLATGSGANLNNPMLIYNINPGSKDYKKQVGSFITHLGVGHGTTDGTSISIFGKTIYLGREKGQPADPKKGYPEEPDYFILDIEDPTNIKILNSKLLGFNSTGALVSGTVVLNGLAFLGITDPNDPFQVWEVPSLFKHNSGSFNFSQGTTGIDFENNYIYTSNTSSKPLTIIKSKP